MVPQKSCLVLRNILGCSGTSWGASVVTNETHLVLQNLSGCLHDDKAILRGALERLKVLQNISGRSGSTQSTPNSTEKSQLLLQNLLQHPNLNRKATLGARGPLGTL